MASLIKPIASMDMLSTPVTPTSIGAGIDGAESASAFDSVSMRSKREVRNDHLVF